MNKKYLLTLTIIIITITSACGGSSEPTMSAEAIAQTAAAEAWLAVTQTQAALPTATIQPTSTPEPTVTLLPTLPPLPTISDTTSVSAATPAPDCETIPQAEPKGALVTVEFYNQAKGSADMAFGMNFANDKGECYTYSFSLGRGDTVSRKVLAGCYWGVAWITGEESSVARSGNNLMCVTDGTIIYKVAVTKETFDFR